MSEENVEIVQRAMRAFNERDFETLRALSHRDAEYHGLASQPDEPRVLRSLDELRRCLNRRDSEFDEFRQEAQEFIDAGERVVVVFEISAIGKQSRAPGALEGEGPRGRPSVVTSSPFSAQSRYIESVTPTTTTW